MWTASPEPLWWSQTPPTVKKEKYQEKKRETWLDPFYAAVARVFFISMNYFKVSQPVSLLLTCLPTYLSTCSSVWAPHTLKSLFAQASFEPVNKHRKLLPASLYPTFSLLPILPPPQTPVWFMGLSSYLAQNDRLFPLLLAFSVIRGIRCKGTARGPAVLSQLSNNNRPPESENIHILVF